MKKTISFLLAAALIVCALAGCSTQTAEKTPDETTTPIEQNNDSNDVVAEPVSGKFSVDGSVIFEKDGIKVTTAGLDVDPSSDGNAPIIWLDIENKGSKDVYLGVANGSVNGFMTEVVLMQFFTEAVDGYFGASSDFGVNLPAGESLRCALGFYGDVSMDDLAEIEFSFCTSPDEFTWRDYVSEPVVISTGKTYEDVDITSYGTTVIDNENMTVVLGEQDYDDWFGPVIEYYIENKTDKFIGVTAETADADGVFCDYIYGQTALAPGKKDAGQISFDGEMRELKGIENLTMTFSYVEADDKDSLSDASAVTLDPVTVQYPAQVWGEYENEGYKLEIRPKINDLLTVEVPENDENGVIFSVYETASKEQGSYDGAGWLFSIAKIDEATFHEMLQGEMSGAESFAVTEDSQYLMYYHPTDVRFERANEADCASGFEQWSMLNDWVQSALDKFREDNGGLESFYRGNTEFDIALAKIAYGGAEYTLSGEEYGEVSGKNGEAAEFAEALLAAWFTPGGEDYEAEGEYVTLTVDGFDTRFDIYLNEGGLVKATWGEDNHTYYETWLYNDMATNGDIARGWYYALAEKAGLKEQDTSLDGFVGDWHEKIAGRGMISVSKLLAPGKVKIEASWPESAAVMNTWEMTARLEDGKLVYENGQWEKNEYDEDGEELYIDGGWEESGSFELIGSELIWHDNNSDHGGDSTFVK